jgi:epoxyqueuosine reductase
LARSVIVITFTNSWGESTAGHPFPAPLAGSPVGYVSAYARETDYHLTGHQILGALQQKLGNPLQAVATVDTRPVYETLFATVGGLGVIGQNGLLRTPALGTRVFVGCLFVDRLLPEVIHEPPMPFSCASCCACLANCPSGALAVDRPITAGRCISYLSIEKKAPLSAAEAATMGDWLFGCDCCTAVCPPAPAADRRIPVDLDWLLRAPAAEVRRTLKGNASNYAGVSRLRRNAVVVLNNLGTDRALELLNWVRQNSGSQLVRQQIDELRAPV